tara:strand:+ start:239 stop:466 length:228 start_codon:yes stop_codon:yes gene_type:complete
MKYVIIDKEEVQHIDWLQICETNEESLRYDINGNKTFVKFNGSTPSFLEGKATLTNEEILAILNNPSNGWVEEEE